MPCGSVALWLCVTLSLLILGHGFVLLITWRTLSILTVQRCLRVEYFVDV